MSGAVIPSWKIALQQKLDKKKEEERRKLLEEEQRRLEALPPWKRMGMMPKNVIIISGGTKTVSQLSTDSDSNDEVKIEENTKRNVHVNDARKPELSGNRSSLLIEGERLGLGHHSHSSQHGQERNRPSVAESTRTTAVNKKAQENHVMSLQNKSKLTNHVDVVEHDEIKKQPMSPRSQEHEGVDEEHVSSVFDNPFLKLDGGMRRRKTRQDNEPSASKKEQDNIRQRSRSASPRRAAREHNVDLKTAGDDSTEIRTRKNSVSDLRSRFGRVASIEDLRIISRKHSELDASPLSPKSPTAVLDRNKLFDEQPNKVHINFKSDSPNKQPRLSPTSRPADTTTTCENEAPSSKNETMVSSQKETKVSSVNTNGISSQKLETNSVSITHAKVEFDPAPSTGKSVTTKRQAPKPPSGSGLSSKTDEMPATSATSSASTSVAQNMLNNDLSKCNKHVESSTASNATEHETLPDQPKTAVLGDGQSSLRRKKGTSKMSASALISLSGDSSSDVQLSEHNARIRAARQEARATSSKNLLRSGRDSESKDTDNIPRGSVSSNTFASQTKPSENHANSKDTSSVDAIPYPANFRQPKKESKDVDDIPYPENFRQPKPKSQETLEPEAPMVNLVRVSKPTDDIPRTNIDDVILTPINETAILDTTNLVNGSMEEKAPPKKIKKKQDVEWIGYNTPAGKPSALKPSKLRKESKKLRISFNEPNLSETYEYQSEESLLNEYLREERGMNGNPRVGNLSRQEAKDEDDQNDEEDVDFTPSSHSGIDNVLAHEGLQNYTPKDLQNFSPTSFRQQQQQREAAKPREETPPPTNEDPDPDDIAITYDDVGDYFSSAGSSSAALLF